MTGMTVREITETVLALMVVGGVVAIAVFGVVSGRPVMVPAELYGFGGIVIGAYFRGTVVNGAVAKITAALAPKETSE